MRLFLQAARRTKKMNETPDYISRGTFKAVDGGKLGILLLHGFTSALDAVSGLIPTLENLGVEYEMPVLRGHNATPDALIGVTHKDWYDDAYAALEKLSQRAERIIVIGLSMGGVVALDLCAKDHPLKNKIVGCVTWAAALGFVNSLAWMAKPLSIFFKKWKGQDSFNDPECRKNNHNYQTFPTKAFVELYDYAHDMRKRLEDVEIPLRIIHSELDQVVPYKTSQLLYDSVCSPFCERYTLHKSGHELGQDCEADTVFELTADFIKKYM